MVRVVLCGTHPDQYNGYSKVVYELAKQLSTYDHIQLYIYGFQNFYDGADHKIARSLPSNVEVYDAFKHEEPKNKGFGETLFVDYVKRIDPDVLIVYNDIVIISTFLDLVKKNMPNHRFKLIPYIDIVYRNEKNSLIAKINEMVDGGIMFTKHWEDTIRTQGFTKPLYVLEHGFNPKQFYPVPKSLARQFFSLKDTDFVILNLNRNQPRKRWDICIMAFVKFLSRNRDAQIRMILAASLQGSWDLVDLIVSESRKYGMTVHDVKKHLVVMQNPQRLTDFDVNVMYNAADVGINTCDGEGFGLCNFEQAGVGVPQVVPNIGGFRDFFDGDTALLLDPKWSFYCDHSRDFVSGEAQVCAVDDYVDALEYMLHNPSARNELGKNARRKIMTHYDWKDKGKKLVDIIDKVAPPTPEVIPIDLTNKVQEGISPTTLQNEDVDNMSAEELRQLVKRLQGV